MTTHTTKEVQVFLNGDGDGPIAEDGLGGSETAAAIARFQAKHTELAVTGKADDKTLAIMFPSNSLGPKTIQATAKDWLINWLTSKTNYIAGALVAALFAWVSMKTGINLPDSTKDAVTVLIGTGFTALIWWVQTFFNSPHVATKQPAVVQKPDQLK